MSLRSTAQPAILFGGVGRWRRAAGDPANATLMAAVGTLIAHRTRPFSLPRASCCFFSQGASDRARGVVVAVGAAVGAALLSKYTALFFLASRS